MKDSDKLLAVVITNKGGFKGRRVNAKAIESIMKGKLDDKQVLNIGGGGGGGATSISTNNSYVFPAGHYYFAQPIRFAGFASP